MIDYTGLFAAPEPPKGRGGHNDSMPVFQANFLLDSPWLDAMLHPSTCQQSQVVPDALELDLAGLEQHMGTDSVSSPSREWSAEEFGDLLLLQQPSCSAHGPLSTFDGADSLAATAALLGDSQEEAPLFAEGLLPANSPSNHQQQQQQQQVPDMPQWVPTAIQQMQQQQQQEEAAPTQTPAPAAAGFVWPCPEELRQLDSSSLAAATAFAAVFPATPASATVTASTPATTSRLASASMPHSQAALTAAADSAGSGTAPAAVAARSKPRAAAKARAGAGSRVQQLLGPAVRTRAEAVARYKAKRARRGSVSRVRYQRRKDYADQRPRVGGRFVKVKGVQPQQPQSQQQAQAQLAQ